MATLFEKYGGFATFSQITQKFYHKILDCPQVSHYFANTNMEKLIDHQTQFLASALGGPATLADIDIKTAHQHLAIKQDDFDIVANLLNETLQEVHVDPIDIEQIETIVYSLKDRIVSE